ncbi:phosphopyruvate hydratase [Haloferax mediterranei ATCC 33500]|uniref:Enolase n=1 Tax=Haloferax mediterranei (strain ATCC 33500 / DSM 1411 / JCM 8866 / NBRC 14739 / NCIMB 2177 / R-4) TaxID=523841 RepID=I3R8A0_HALMT|nr:phosphopyruvate hydratase [Haloferax mediterranei]AFK20460.1 phosphopyruvate hydratase [Haloferax mediterranei ATCC 33500]AHZ23822.1 enolase [Haloferax mediterranei ATCC 33500]ELZ98245.1 enolase [Haloferax mediterranei ATCC 33500]MDX5986783.1 phosphopyruvate hydratase [Haloferax mediterranei ATCC 33500]QCQ76108.1 phosphopyruvate hydratase [Haloferax mediterranei ATCC 33500]
MTRITSVSLRRVLDSRGNPTVEADVLTESGGFGRAAAPSGASTGEYEAIELPPTEAIAAARRHAVPRLVGEVHAGNQREVDAALRAADGSENFSEIGANSAVAISMAAAKAGADVLGAPLYQHLGGAFRGDNFPTPLGNVIGGGEHAKEATNIQEFLAAPVGAPSVSEAVFANAKVHARASEILDERDVPAAKGDEGAWAPAVSDADAFEIMAEAVSDVEDELGFEIRFGLDIAASEMFEDGVYHYGDETKTTDEQIDYVAEMVDEYDLVYVEDPLDENDYEGFAELTDRVGDRTLICGDDLFVTNVDRLQDGIDVGAANSILIKPNQIGTLTDAFDAVELAARNGMDAVISHRSGETEDTTIAHLAVATDAPFIKTGTVQGERTAKLNELIRIADDAV